LLERRYGAPAREPLRAFILCFVKSFIAQFPKQLKLIIRLLPLQESNTLSALATGMYPALLPASEGVFE
jgi:hypothetical protein